MASFSDNKLVKSTRIYQDENVFKRTVKRNSFYRREHAAPSPVVLVFKAPIYTTN